MARKSRKVAAAEPSVCEAAPLQIFPTAIYARLSVENSGKSEKVDVITNQIEICKSYIAGRPYLDLRRCLRGQRTDGDGFRQAGV